MFAQHWRVVPRRLGKDDVQVDVRSAFRVRNRDIRDRVAGSLERGAKLREQAADLRIELLQKVGHRHAQPERRVGGRR